jgi:hypothetical protein
VTAKTAYTASSWTPEYQADYAFATTVETVSVVKGTIKTCPPPKFKSIGVGDTKWLRMSRVGAGAEMGIPVSAHSRHVRGRGRLVPAR